MIFSPDASLPDLSGQLCRPRAQIGCHVARPFRIDSTMANLTDRRRTAHRQRLNNREMLS
jgi:hypothetical protein